MLENGFLTLIVSDTVNAGLCALKLVALQLDAFMQKFEARKALLARIIADEAFVIFVIFSCFIILEERFLHLHLFNHFFFFIFMAIIKLISRCHTLNKQIH